MTATNANNDQPPTPTPASNSHFAITQCRPTVQNEQNSNREEESRRKEDDGTLTASSDD
jgi:hypothetical protein